LVEQLICNQPVGGSNPLASSIKTRSYCIALLDIHHHGALLAHYSAINNNKSALPFDPQRGNIITLEQLSAPEN
jgi:hypothetical protein